MADGTFQHGRHAGVLVPLFSIPSRASWGVGEIADLPRFARWLAAAGPRLRAAAAGQRDGGRAELAVLRAERDGDRSGVHRARATSRSSPRPAARRRSTRPIARGSSEARRRPAVDFRTVRALKRVALSPRLSRVPRAASRRERRAPRDFQAFAERERWWLDDYALFRALHDEHHGCYWRDWEPELRDREPGALDARASGSPTPSSITSICSGSPTTQWQRARRECGRVGIFGDFPFMVSGHSADVWARQHEFRIDASVGVPPDAFSETGQDWGLPVYRWDAIAAGRLRVAAAARPPLRRALRRLPRRSPGRLLPHLRARARRPHVLHARRRAVADRAGRAAPRHLPRERRPHHRRRPRRRPRLRPRVAGAGESRRAEGAALGARLAHARPAVQATRPITPPSRSRSAARTTPRRWRSGGTAPTGASASCAPRFRAARGRLRSRRALRRPHSATRCFARCSAPAPTSSSSRSRTCSAGAIASTCRPSSTTRTGPGGCPGRSTICRSLPEARRARRIPARASLGITGGVSN